MRLYLAERHGALIAGSIVLALGRTAFYAFNGRLRSALALRPNEVLQWEAIHDACRRGYELYDLGEVVAGGDGLAEFKRKWGAEEVHMHRYYHPPPSRTATRPAAEGSRRARKCVWPRLPLGGDAAGRRPRVQVAVRTRRLAQLGGTTSGGDAARALALAARPGG